MAEIDIYQANSTIENLEQTISTLWEYCHEWAYIVWNALAKAWKRLQDAHKEWFRKYYDENKELPWWYKCTVSQWRLVIEYEYDEEWKQLNDKIKAREEKLKNVVQQSIKWNAIMDENWEIIDPVPFHWADDVYSITKK